MKKFLVLPAFVLAAALIGCEPAETVTPVVESTTTAVEEAGDAAAAEVTAAGDAAAAHVEAAGDAAAAEVEAAGDAAVVEETTAP